MIEIKKKTFQEIAGLVNERFVSMQKQKMLFRSNVTGRELWNLYISNFKEEDDPVFRDPNSSTHTCNLDKSFILRYGNTVTIEDGQIVSMWDLELDKNDPYYKSLKAMSDKIKQSSIAGIFVETYDSLNVMNYEKTSRNANVHTLGIPVNYKIYTKEEANAYPNKVRVGEPYEFHHFFGKLSGIFVDTTGKSIEAIVGHNHSNFSVFKRAMEEFNEDTLDLVLQLIDQGSLKDSNSYRPALEHTYSLLKQYNTVNKKELWLWEKAYFLPENVCKFRNNLLGTFCVELCEGKDLNKAWEDWNKRVDPQNYQKTVAPITKRQIEDAKKFVEKNGYSESFDRRIAKLSDIDVSDIKHTKAEEDVAPVSVFDKVSPSKPTRHKRSQFDNVDEVSIDKFMTDILPKATSIEVFVENWMIKNFATLTTAKSKDAKNPFKWNNTFSKTFIGNLAGKSDIKNAVKSRGGITEAFLRCSMHFPETTDDYDLHMYEPNGEHIYFRNCKGSESKLGGMLDLDAQGMDGHQPPDKRVENIVYQDNSKMVNGKYELEVVNYSSHTFPAPFTIEIENNGEIETYSFHPNSKSHIVATIHYKDGEVTIKPGKEAKIIESKTVSREVWGIDTNQFHKVELLCLSPGYWGENKVGDKYYLFMLEGCNPEGKVRTFHNQDLNSELHKHRKVMEVLGLSTMVEGKGLAGVGFNATVRQEVLLKVKGSFNRIIKVKL